jgi:tetratricopeptide (TPR) repeat protein
MKRDASVRPVTAAALAVLVYCLSAQVAAQSGLGWQVRPALGQAQETDFVFRILGKQASQPFELTFANVGSELLIFTVAAKDALSITVLKDGVEFPVKINWDSAVTVERQEDGTQGTFPWQDVTLGPKDSLEAVATISPASGDHWSEGTFDVLVSVAAAAPHLKLVDGSAWKGVVVAKNQIRLLFEEPATRQDWRLYHSIRGWNAWKANDWPGATLHLDEMLKLDTDDTDARWMKGQLLMQQGRFQEAKAEFEAAMPTLDTAPALMLAPLAYVYVALGESAKAETVLRAQRIPATQVPGEIEKYRAIVKRSFPNR